MRKLTLFGLVALLLLLVSACNGDDPDGTATPPPDDAVTVTPTETGGTAMPQPVCTRPACGPDEVYACGAPDGCPGGCGTICVMPTPNPDAVTPEPVTLPPAPEGDWEVLATWLTNAWLTQYDVADVQAALQTAGWQDETADWQIADMDGDQRAEWLATLHDPTVEALPFGRPGQFWVVNQAGVVFRQPRPTMPDKGLSVAPVLVATADMTGDGWPELVINEEECGAHTCFGNYMVVGATADGFVNLLAPDSDTESRTRINISYPEVMVTDADGDGRSEFLLNGGGIGSTGAGIVRTHTETWGWDGAFVTLQDWEWDATSYRHHILYEANEAYAADDLDWALLLYEKAINDQSLDNELFFGEPDAIYADISQFAAFRLILIDLQHNNRPQAVSRLAGMGRTYPGTPLTQAAGTLIANWGKVSLPGLCQQIDSFLAGYERPTGTLLDLGYGNPSLAAADVCP